MAQFRQVNEGQSNVHHDALEFPNGQIVLLTQLCEGQHATVLQLPAGPITFTPSASSSAATIGPTAATAMHSKPLSSSASRPEVRSAPPSWPTSNCHAERIRVVLDNLSTHSPGALYQALPAPEARWVFQRLEFHYTPKHASWLNMVEIEIGVMRSQCLDRRIGDREQLIAEIAAWERQHNQSGARINWMFSTEKARTKMARAYPKPAFKES